MYAFWLVILFYIAYGATFFAQKLYEIVLGTLR